MEVRQIRFHPSFPKDFGKLNEHIQNLAERKIQLFRSNPLHPSLRLHALKGKLQGKWSVSINMKIRIVFERLPNGDLVFLSIGSHDIYHSL